MSLAAWQNDTFTKLIGGRGHAWLLSSSGAQGHGLAQFDLALLAAKTWLCESPEAAQACQSCAACQLVEAKTHPDLRILVPEIDALAMGLSIDEKSQKEIDDKKRKPSRDIRVEAIRDLVAFAQNTSARGKGLVCLIYPAQRMNVVSANALLKTLEEPAGQARFILVSDDASGLLPTIRSRCQTLHVQVPDKPLAPELQNLPAQLAKGLTPAQLPELLQELPVLVHALQKVCHDAMCVAAGAAPRFFKLEVFDKPNLKRLIGWSKNLSQHALNAEHTFNAALMQEALLAESAAALR